MTETDGDHLFPSSAEVKNAWSFTSAPSVCLHGVVLSQAQAQLYLFGVMLHINYICYRTSDLNFVKWI